MIYGRSIKYVLETTKEDGIHFFTDLLPFPYTTL